MSNSGSWNPIRRMQHFMSTVKGQMVLNYAYNWGASVVIMGTLFKLIHLPGANTMLCVGMGTEVFIFFISAFDLSGVKKTDFADEPDTASDEYDSIDTTDEEEDENFSHERFEHQGRNSYVPEGGPVQGGPSVVVVQQGGAGQQAAFEAPQVHPAGTPLTETQPAGVQTGQSYSGQPYMGQPIQPVQPPQPPQPEIAQVSPEMEEATTAYLEQLKAMTEMMARCTKQAESINQDTDQMVTLSKNLAGINAIYELQLRSASTQIGNIDQVQEQTRRMAKLIEDLNEVYNRMLQAMTNSNPTNK